MNRNEFLELIKQRRKSCGISKYKAAKDSGLTWQQIDFLDSAYRSFSLKMIFTYLGALGACLCLTNEGDSAMVSSPKEAADFIKSARRKRGMKRVELADAAGCPLITIENTERMTTGVRTDLFLKILEVLGYRVSLAEKEVVVSIT